MIARVLLIGLGGALGSVARYLTALAAARWLGLDFPYGTLVANLVGSFLIGLVQELAMDSLLVPEQMRLFLVTGVMGGLTTYSAFSYETVRLIQTEAWGRALVNVGVTTTLCLGLCVLGMAAGRALLRGQA
jgi:CrcB protein